MAAAAAAGFGFCCALSGMLGFDASGFDDGGGGGGGGGGGSGSDLSCN